MNQIAYNTSRGHFLEMTHPDSALQILRFAIHFDPLIAIFSPFYWIWPHAEVLIVGQIVMSVSGAIPVYLLAKKVFFKTVPNVAHLLSLLVVFVFLNNYLLLNAAIYDFHAVVVSGSLLLWAWYFFVSRRLKLSFVVFTLAILGKENVALTTMMMGLYILLFQKKFRLFGSLLTAVSIIGFLLIVGVIIPSNRDSFHFAQSFYTLNLGDNVRRLFSMETGRYFITLVSPFSPILFYAPIFLLILTPEFLINTLSSSANMRMDIYHYTALLIPILSVSLIYGLDKFIIYNSRSRYSRKAIGYACVLILFSSIATHYINAPKFSWYVFENSAKLGTIRSLQARFADDTIPVSASGHLGPYFSSRRYYYNFLFDFAYGNTKESTETVKERADKYENATYVIVDLGEVEQDNELVAYYYNRLKTDKNYSKIFSQNRIVVYKKEYHTSR